MLLICMSFYMHSFCCIFPGNLFNLWYTRYISVTWPGNLLACAWLACALYICKHKITLTCINFIMALGLVIMRIPFLVQELTWTHEMHFLLVLFDYHLRFVYFFYISTTTRRFIEQSPLMLKVEP